VSAMYGGGSPCTAMSLTSAPTIRPLPSFRAQRRSPSPKEQRSTSRTCT
jgi:hypothetical protein